MLILYQLLLTLFGGGETRQLLVTQLEKHYRCLGEQGLLRGTGLESGEEELCSGLS